MVFSYRRASRGLPTIEGPIAMEELKRSSRFKGTRSYRRGSEGFRATEKL